LVLSPVTLLVGIFLKYSAQMKKMNTMFINWGILICGILALFSWSSIFLAQLS
jgi:hypothetical protein